MVSTSSAVTLGPVVLGFLLLVGASGSQTTQTGASCRRPAEVFLIDAETRGARNVTNNGPSADHSPTWSPDGRSIAFERDGRIFAINSNGGRARQLSRRAVSARDPAWSPDGTRIAFASNRGGSYDVFVMRADGGGLTKLTAAAGDETDPAWSPDGTRIAFASNPGGDYDVFVMRSSDGSGQTNLTAAAGDDTDPAWSPDGTRIAFASNRGGDYDVYVMNADGSAEAPLTTDPRSDAEPAWSPEGTRIAFARDSVYIGLGLGIVVMNPDGSGQRNLTENYWFDDDPAWSPDGRRIAFSRDFGVPRCCLGVQPCRVPPIVGLRLGAAKARIRRAACAPGRVRYARSLRHRGRVIGQSPDPGTGARAWGSCVYPTVSSGPR